MAVTDKFNLKGFSSVHEQTLNNELQDNIVEFFDWGLLEKGNYFNVTKGELSPSGDDYSLLKPITDARYDAGQAWQAFRSNWVWQMGVSYVPGPQVGSDVNYPGITGVYVDDVLYPPSTTGTYSYKVDYYHGRVIFNTAIPATSVVQAEYSYKYINVEYAEALPWLREIQKDTNAPHSDFQNSKGGEWEKPDEMRLQLPAIAVEVVPRRQLRGVQLGGGQHAKTDVLFHCIAEDSPTVKKMIDIVSLQNRKIIHLFDSNAISTAGDFPLDHIGTPVANAMEYKDLLTNHPYNRAKFDDVSADAMVLNVPGLFGGVVKMSVEVTLNSI
jgi:hypothetical protein